MAHPIVVSDSNFSQEVLNSSIPVAVDFWAEWCGPCRMLSPIVEQVSDELANSVKICKLNVDENPVAAADYNVMSIPTIIIFKDGRVVDELVGLMPKQQIVERLKRFV